ncbi:MAG TPA: methyltransferase domain-containing protein [Gaiellaceae bacterium]|nr:methyltransferase domain-containing protein [Gaiellaceae bacterium]
MSTRSGTAKAEPFEPAAAAVFPAATDIPHPRFARFFDRVSRALDERGQAEHRAVLLAGLRGRVVEVGAGNGLNFPHYPATVTEVVAVEPEPYLRARAVEAAAHAPVPVSVVAGCGEALPLPDDSVDAGVASLVLCSVGDQGRALAELRRVIRPGGDLRYYEHVVSSRPLAARAQRVFDLVWPRIAGGCHASRDTRAAIERAGFVIERQDAFSFKPLPLSLPTAPHILGRARNPNGEHGR